MTLTVPASHCLLLTSLLVIIEQATRLPWIYYAAPVCIFESCCYYYVADIFGIASSVAAIFLN